MKGFPQELGGTLLTAPSGPAWARGATGTPAKEPPALMPYKMTMERKWKIAKEYLEHVKMRACPVCSLEWVFSGVCELLHNLI